LLESDVKYGKIKTKPNTSHMYIYVMFSVFVSF
jgi:hypothetical protein